MTHLDTVPLAGWSTPSANCSGSLGRVLPMGVAQRMMLIALNRCGRSLSLGAIRRIAFALCAMTLALSPASTTLVAQPPSVETSQETTTDGTTAPAPAAPSLPSDLDFDLGTDEFENFGEEGFQVEEENYFRDTVVPIAIRVAIAAVVILLLAWVAMKLVKPKPPTSAE